MSALKYWLWLSAAADVSPKAKAALINHFGDPEAAFFAPDEDIRSVNGISRRESDILLKRDLSRAGQIESDCGVHYIDIITMQDVRYPERLRNIFAPPVVIYAKGRNINIDEEPLIAVVGTRKATDYGIRMADVLGRDIARCGGGVVNGLSEGVDFTAMRSAIREGGTCVGVLGTSLDKLDGELLMDLVYDGMLISEYPPGTKPQRSFFRDRNRISSALSVGAVAVEAPEKSGTLLFMAEALEQGKEIFAVPGNADASMSFGTNEILKHGGKPVTCGWDVMCEFEDIFPGRVHPTAGTVADAKAYIPEKPKDTGEKDGDLPDEKPKEDKKVIDNKNDKEYIDLRSQLSNLSEKQLQIINAIEKDCTHMDEIAEKTALPIREVLTNVTVMCVKGVLKKLPGNRVALNLAKK